MTSSVKRDEETLVGDADDLGSAQTIAADASSPSASGGSLIRSVESTSRTGLTGGTGHTSGTGRSLRPGTGNTELGPTPAQTLVVEEIHRTRTFLKIAMGMATVVLASGSLLEGDPFAHRVLESGMAAIVGASAWLLWVMREDAGYTVRRLMIAGYAAVYGALAGIYFFGPFSPAPVVVPFGLYFFSLSQSFRATLVVYALCAGGYLVLGGGAIFGVLEDRGVITGDSISTFTQVIIVGLVEGIFLSTYLIGRGSRSATLKAVEQHDRVARSLAQREALLLEAKNELDRALRAGGVGRYTDQVLGSYRVGKVLGRGAMGEVYEATHVESGSPAAIKLLQAEMLRSPDSIRRFIREAQIAASLRVRHVVEVYEIGGLDAPIPYITMERLEGTDLSDHLRQHGRLSLDDTIRMVREVAKGLEAAREAGIVHRDLKPGNLFHARRDGDKHVWKILDFGVSKLIGTMQGTLTQENALIGTPEYMAPEQPLGRDVTHRTDIYALGVIAYRALTGSPAFTGDGLMDTIYNVVNRMPPRPTEIATHLPREVDWVLAIAMAKNAEDRFETATDLATALGRVKKGEIDEELVSRAVEREAADPWGTVGAK